MTALLAVAAAIATAAALDWLVREPPTRLHPVVWFGRVVVTVDREWRYPRTVGLVAALVLPLTAASAAGAAVLAAAAIGRALATLAGAAAPALYGTLAGTVVAALSLFASSSLRELLETADGVLAAAETDLAAARERLPALVGRDPAALDADRIRSAVVESAAENLSDGLVAPLLGFTLGGPVALALAPGSSALAGTAPIALAGSAGAAAWVKGVNTMDSVLGYPDRPHGTAAARLDDVVMAVPARLTALLLSLAARSPDPALSARRWADAPASPNAGWPIGTIAAALGVRLEKPGAYDVNAVAPFPDREEARRGIALVGRAGALSFVVATLAEVVAWRY